MPRPPVTEMRLMMVCLKLSQESEFARAVTPHPRVCRGDAWVLSEVPAGNVGVMPKIEIEKVAGALPRPPELPYFPSNRGGVDPIVEIDKLLVPATVLRGQTLRRLLLARAGTINDIAIHIIDKTCLAVDSSTLGHAVAVLRVLGAAIESDDDTRD